MKRSRAAQSGDNQIDRGNARAEELVPAQQDFAGQLIIGEDLLQLGVRRTRH